MVEIACGITVLAGDRVRLVPQRPGSEQRHVEAGTVSTVRIGGVLPLTDVTESVNDVRIVGLHHCQSHRLGLRGRDL